MTESELYLSNLCQKAFLKFWSFPHLYRDQGRSSLGHGKELCDLLVVFGDQVLIFSDKHCVPRENTDIETTWRRWYTRAVLDSAKQIYGAERWLSNYPSRVFTDRNCTQPLPVDIPRDPVVHRIVTCRGAAKLTSEIFGSKVGSLLVTNQALDKKYIEPFCVGSFGEGTKMVHVFDECALDIVLVTLDTISDFCEYLRKRELFFRSYENVIATGEEELLGYYLKNISDKGDHDFIVRHKTKPNMVLLDTDSWNWWLHSEQKVAKENANKVSYCWDALIEKFSHHILNGTQFFHDYTSVRDLETLIRWMAAEDRVRRRILANTFIEGIELTDPGNERRRCVKPMGPGQPWWIFVIWPKPEAMAYEEYRLIRREMLCTCCIIIKYLNPGTMDICGIAVGYHTDEVSEDLMYLDCRQWTDAQNSDAREAYEKTRWFSKGRWSYKKQYEFPLQRKPRNHSASWQKKMKKSMRKQKRQARKLNRRAK